MKKSAIAPNTKMMSQAEFMAWTKTKDMYSQHPYSRHYEKYNMRGVLGAKSYHFFSISFITKGANYETANRYWKVAYNKANGYFYVTAHGGK